MNTFNSFPLYTVFMCNNWHVWVKVSRSHAVCVSDSMQVTQGEVYNFNEYQVDQQFLIIK